MNYVRVAFQRYTRVLNKHPLIVQSSQAGLLMGVGDCICQTAVEKNKFTDLDWRRTARFASVGLCITGPLLRTWYRFLARRIGEKGAVVTVKKVLIDQILFAPVLLGTIVSSVGIINGLTAEQLAVKFRRDYPDILITGYCIWPWVQLCNFYLVPLNYQVLVVNCVALFWNTYLSWKSNTPVQKLTEPPA